MTNTNISMKKCNIKVLLTLVVLFSAIMGARAQGEVRKFEFCDRKYEYADGKDSITLFFNLFNRDGQKVSQVDPKDFDDFLELYEDGKPIPKDKRKISLVGGGRRIPNGTTFSVLVDLNIDGEGKEQIFRAIQELVRSAPDSSVFLSFYGADVKSSIMLTKDNCASYRSAFDEVAGGKYFYSAIYAKMVEFLSKKTEYETNVKGAMGYQRNPEIARRASTKEGKGRNFLLVFAESRYEPSYEEETKISFRMVDELMGGTKGLPVVYAFYYPESINEDVKNTLDCITGLNDEDSIGTKKGAVNSCHDIESVLESFQKVVSDLSYDFAFTYQVDGKRTYKGHPVAYLAKWSNEEVGDVEYSIGSPDHPWPERDTPWKYLWALLVTLLPIVLFILVMKIIVPAIKSRMFAYKYYNRYVPKKEDVREICYYCKQTLQSGDMVVTKCKHVMHVYCWKRNHYHCAEYGQNCKEDSRQEHVEWDKLFSSDTMRDSRLTIVGAFAGLAGWVIYELTGRGAMFSSIARAIAKLSLGKEIQKTYLFDGHVNTMSAFLAIGLLLGFLLSLVFRYHDEYRYKDGRTWLKIIGLSVFSGIVGMLAFAIGAACFGLLVSASGTTYTPWYCSLPAYLIFSLALTLSLTVKSTIPVKSALWGGLCSAFIGFLVLYFNKFTPNLDMLLNFIIYGGGLGASLYTVRMLAERYFLRITNGVREGTRIPIHKWMGATGGGQVVTIGMTIACEIQMNWEKSNNVSKEHAQLYIDHERKLPMLKPLDNVVFNSRANLTVGKPIVLANGDTFKIGDTIFKYEEE